MDKFQAKAAYYLSVTFPSNTWVCLKADWLKAAAPFLSSEFPLTVDLWKAVFQTFISSPN